MASIGSAHQFIGSALLVFTAESETVNALKDKCLSDSITEPEGGFYVVYFYVF